ncbi:MAG: hypothetical protein VX638_10970 [Chloroflexota bacterium]|nr:hypothetical protein [Chloroflexota bacterium]
MRGLLSVATLVLVLSLAMLISLAASPLQDNPPQPFGPDVFTGRVSVLNDPPPLGMLLFACIDDCSTYKSAVVGIKEEGAYSQLVVGPTDRALLGHTISFFLANEFGNIQAAETVDFVGATDYFTLDLHFEDSVPVPTPTPSITPTASLPVPGDLTVTAMPRFALIVGAIAVVIGIGILMAARRRAA